MTQANEWRLTKAPGARAQMLIHRPVAEVFEAIVDPQVTSNFWFSRGSGRLEPGCEVEWVWETYGASARVKVREFEPIRRIVMDWGDDDNVTMVEWIFTPYSESATLLQVVNRGFRGTGDEIVSQAIGSTEAFALVLAGLKAYLDTVCVSVSFPITPPRCPMALGLQEKNDVWMRSLRSPLGPVAFAPLAPFDPLHNA